MFNMDHKEPGTVNKPPVLHPDSNFSDWKERFAAFCDYRDVNIWTSIKEGYIPPQTSYNGRLLPTPYSGLNDEQKEAFKHEKKAMATLKMALTRELLHQVKKFPTAKEMFDAVEKIYMVNEDIKKEQEGTEEKVEIGHADELTEEIQDKSDTVSHSCSNCNDLQVKVDKLSGQNQKLMAEGTELVRMLKSYEQEISCLKNKVNELSQIINLARQTADDKTNELTDFVPSTPAVVDPITVDLTDSPVSLKRIVGSNSTPHKVDEDTKDETVKTFKK